MCAYVVHHVSLSLSLTSLSRTGFTRSRTARARGNRGQGENTCARLKNTPRPLLVCRNLLTRRLFAYAWRATTPSSSFNRRENFRACNSRQLVGRPTGRPAGLHRDHPGLSFFVVSQIRYWSRPRPRRREIDPLTQIARRTNGGSGGSDDDGCVVG